jgi:hypothetical protein
MSVPWAFERTPANGSARLVMHALDAARAGRGIAWCDESPPCFSILAYLCQQLAVSGCQGGEIGHEPESGSVPPLAVPQYGVATGSLSWLLVILAA